MNERRCWKYAVVAMMLPIVVSFLSVLAFTVQAGPLVREVTSSPIPYSQVIVAQDGSRDISLILDREEYDPLDVTGVALIRFRSGEKRLDDLRVRLQLHDSQGQPVLKEELRDLRGEHLDVTLALDRVRLGNYTLHAILADRAGARLAEATAPLRFAVRKRGFNLLDEVRLNGSLISRQDARAGLELTDHEGNVYRASNDPNVQVSVEETGPVRTTIRATGWYVKDGTSGERLSPMLPTDRLCRHDTRITAYAASRT